MTELLTQIVTLGSIRYKGCTITQGTTGWHVFGFRYDTVEQAKNRVDSGYNAIKNSLR